MANDSQKAVERANKAGKAYKEFLKREGKSKFFTESQKQKRKESFLESHIGIYEDYVNTHPQQQGWPGLNADAQRLAQDVAEYKNSLINRQAGIEQPAGGQPENILGGIKNNEIVIKNNEIKNEDSINIEDNINILEDSKSLIIDRKRINNKDNAKIDLQGKAFENYLGRISNKEINDVTRHEGDVQVHAADSLAEGVITEAQKKGIRDICAFMYLNTKKHQKFVDGIVSRPLWEKLLMFYIVETGRIHNIVADDYVAAARHVPSVDRFEAKVKYSKHWYKFGGKDINWNLISDASSTAFRHLDAFIGVAGKNKNTTEKKKGKGISGLLEEEEKNNGNSFLLMGLDDNLIIDEKDSESKLKEDFEDDQSFGIDEINGKESSKPVGTKEDSFIKSNIITNLQDEIVETNKKALQIKDALLKGDKIDELAKDMQILNDSMLVLGKKTAKVVKAGDLYKELQIGAPGGGGSNLKALDKELQYRTKYVGIMRKILALGQSSLKSVIEQRITDAKNAYPGGVVPEGVDEPTGEFYGSQTLTDISTWTGVIVDSPMLLVGVLNTITQFLGFFGSWKATGWRDLIDSAMGVLNSAASTGKSGISTTQTVASMVSNVGWGSKGKSAVAAGLKTTAGYLGIVSGGLTTGIGLWQLYNTGHKRSLLTGVGKEMTGKDKDLKQQLTLAEGKQRDDLLQEQEGLKSKHQIMTNILEANRKNVKNKQVTAGLETFQGALTTASGYLTLTAGASLGATGIAALATSGVALVLGIISTVIKKKSKGKEVKSVIDDYIGMDSLCRDYIRKNRDKNLIHSDEAFIKSQGGMDKIRDNIRLDVVGALGYPSLKKFYSEIMYQYAQFLYMEAFYKNGRKVSEGEVKNKKTGEVLDKTKHSCKKLIESLGLDVNYGDNKKEPSPGVNDIYKKLTG